MRFLLVLLLLLLAVAGTGAAWVGPAEVTMAVAEEVPDEGTRDDVGAPTLPVPTADDDDDASLSAAGAPLHAIVISPCGRGAFPVPRYGLGPSHGHARATEHPPRA